MTYTVRTSNTVLLIGSVAAVLILAFLTDGSIAWKTALAALVVDVTVSSALVSRIFFASKKAVVQLPHMETDDLSLQSSGAKPVQKPDVQVLGPDAAREWLDNFLVEQQKSGSQTTSSNKQDI